ncbi:MAG: zinc ABC transporter substrate-binding protein [candidate division Zixibacteria bacterium]|nr:zinc ABC transporter substrate-binding protein [candidate division Zixibacteria bacterium]
MNKILLLSIILFFSFGLASGEINVVTSTSDLSYFANEIGGDLVKANSIASPKSDIHFVEVRPSYMAKLTKADIVFKVGMGVDKWMDKLIDGSRNNNLTIVDCSKYIEPLEVPTFKPDARHGDIHPEGNPHYWLGPQNAEPILKAITEGLVSVDPENESIYRSNMDNLLDKIMASINDLKLMINQLKDVEIIYYHNSWPYFNAFIGLHAAGFIEPYPGVPPSPSHIKEVIELIKNHEIKIIAMEPYFDKRVPRKIASETGAEVVVLYPSIGGRAKGETYQDWMEGNINALLEILR